MAIRQDPTMTSEEFESKLKPVVEKAHGLLDDVFRLSVAVREANHEGTFVSHEDIVTCVTGVVFLNDKLGAVLDLVKLHQARKDHARDMYEPELADIPVKGLPC